MAKGEVFAELFEAAETFFDAAFVAAALAVEGSQCLVVGVDAVEEGVSGADGVGDFGFAVGGLGNEVGHDLVEVALEEGGFDFQAAVEVALVAGELFDEEEFGVGLGLELAAVGFEDAEGEDAGLVGEGRLALLREIGQRKASGLSLNLV